MKKITIQCNYKKYKILIPDYICKTIICMDDLKILKERIKYSIKSGEYLREKDIILYRVSNISSILNTLSYKRYNVLYNSDNNCFEVFKIEEKVSSLF